MNKLISTLALWFLSQLSYAFGWQDLWQSPDQQAQSLMKSKLYGQAKERFQDKAWRATAAYKMGDYAEASKDFGSLDTALGYYNQGNALAKLGQYKQAIAAYDKALKIEPKHQDAIYNRHLLEELEKKSQPKDKQQSSKNEEQSKQDQNSKSPPENSKPKEEQDKDSKPKEPKKSKAVKQESQPKPEAAKPEPKPSSTEQEKQQAKQQWMRLIPDEPGGLLREKFLRDYLRKQRGWYR